MVPNLTSAIDAEVTKKKAGKKAQWNRERCSMRERWREKRGRERGLAGQRGWRWTKIKRDAGSTQTVGEQ